MLVISTTIGIIYFTGLYWLVKIIIRIHNVRVEEEEDGDSHALSL